MAIFNKFFNKFGDRSSFKKYIFYIYNFLH